MKDPMWSRDLFEGMMFEEPFDEILVGYEEIPPETLELLGKLPISPKEFPALYWLAKEIHVHPDDIASLLEQLRTDSSRLYRVMRRQKKNGSWKEFCAPDKSLMKIQDNINRHILRFLKPARNVYGFSGGSIVGAITPHLGSRVILCVDVVDAFPSVKSKDVLDWLTEGRSMYIDEFGRFQRLANPGWFSWYAAKAITDLVTFKGFLPRGAPTSPRIFDLICEPLDKALQKLADKVGGIYTRYADNIYFSMPVDSFPSPVRNAILKRIEGYRRKGPCFNWHKLKILKMGGNSVRALGLNIAGKKIHNTRSFKRQLRFALHHVNWLLDHGEDHTKAWQWLQGLMQFAQRETISPQLLEAYAALKKRVTSLS